MTNLSQSYYNVSTINLSQTAWSVYNTVNNQTTGLQALWDYSESMRVVAWDAYNDIAVFTQDFNNLNAEIGNTGIITPDDTNGIFGKLMSVSLVAHNAFDNNVYLTGQFNNLSMCSKY